MSLGFAFALLLTLQSLQLVSTQTSTSLNLESPPLVNRIPEEWLRGNDTALPEETLEIPSNSMAFSGEGEYQADNQTETETSVVTGHYDPNDSSTPSSTLSSIPAETDTTPIQQNSTNPDTPNIYLETSTTNSSLEETNPTAASPENFTTTTTTNDTTSTTTTTTTPVLNITESSESTESGNPMTTNPPPVTDDTFSSENSTSTTVFKVTTTTQNDSSVSETSLTSTTNATGGSFDVRENVDRGLSSDVQQKSKSQAWGAILGIGVAVAIVALVVYVIVKRRNYRHFSHRKLVEDLPPGPVLRLDNSEPLDFKFDGAAYYNPGLQGDNIQMTNFPQGHTH